MVITTRWQKCCSKLIKGSGFPESFLCSKTHIHIVTNKLSYTDKDKGGNNYGKHI